MLGITYNHQRNRRANKKVYLETDSPGTEFSVTSETGPIRLDFFFFTSTHQELTLLILLLSKKSQKEQKKGESGFGFELIIC